MRLHLGANRYVMSRTETLAPLLDLPRTTLELREGAIHNTGDVAALGIVLESDDTHTILRGSFGERELAPHPMKIAPVKKEERHAMVDC